MPEPITTVGLGAIAAYLGKDGLAKLLGPTADYLGGELQEFTKKRINNIGRIFSGAEKKLGDKINEPGQVPPKVLKTIINEGSYSEDNITIEYFGGVLASSRTEMSRDDRGARVARILDNLSTYQLRTHYLIYSTISEIFSKSNKTFGLSTNRGEMQIFMPFQGYVQAMGFTQSELDNPQILSHIFHGLFADGLIEGTWQYGDQESLKRITKDVPGDGIICQPSASGAELFLWAFGHGDKALDFVLTEGFSANIDGIPKIVSNAVSTKT